MNRRQAIWMAIAASTAVSRSTFSATSLPIQSDESISDEEIRRILIDRIDRGQQTRGIVVGITNAKGSRFVAHGNLDDAHSATVRPKTIFELGSVTKVFTSLLLTDAVQRNEVALADAAEMYLPFGMKALERNGKPVTLENLATHTSGLPPKLTILARDPARQGTATMTVEEAYSDKPEDLYRFLSAYTLTRDPGAQFEYSNLGMALLGHILAKRAGTTFASLLDARVLKPLRMTSTGGPSAQVDNAQVAVGHDTQLNKVPPDKGITGAGGLHSSAGELIHFLNVAMGISKSSLKPAFDSLLSTRRPIAPDLDQALGWQIRKFKDQEIVCKGGNNFGFCAFSGFDALNRIGVVVLSNSSIEVADIGLHILRTDYPLTKVRAVIPIDPAKLDGYVGRYRFSSPPLSVDISRQENGLFAELNGSPKLRLYREKDQTFFLKEIELSFEFQTDMNGQATGFTMRQRNVPDVLIPRFNE